MSGKKDLRGIVGKKKIPAVCGSAGSRLVLVREGINLNNWWGRRASKISLAEKAPFISQHITIWCKLMILRGESCHSTLLCSSNQNILVKQERHRYCCMPLSLLWLSPIASLSLLVASLRLNRQTVRLQQSRLSMFRFCNDTSLSASLARGSVSAEEGEESAKAAWFQEIGRNEQKLICLCGIWTNLDFCRRSSGLSSMNLITGYNKLIGWARYPPAINKSQCFLLMTSICASSQMGL